MARTPMVAGNWKMHKTREEAEAHARAMLPELNELAGVEIVLCPAYVALDAVARAVEGTHVLVGAQNMHWEKQGAFTGEVSPLMLKPLSTYVILGHSERRQFFGESDENVNKRLQAALEHGLKPILCIGETFEERESGRTTEVVGSQLQGAVKGLESALTQDLVIAYEPVWAIGTGVAATPEDAGEVIDGTIRPFLAQRLSPALAESIRVLYGGSVNAKNAEAFFLVPAVDGALVGGASLDAAEFVAIARAAAFS